MTPSCVMMLVLCGANLAFNMEVWNFFINDLFLKNNKGSMSTNQNKICTENFRESCLCQHGILTTCIGFNC